MHAHFLYSLIFFSDDLLYFLSLYLHVLEQSLVREALRMNEVNLDEWYGGSLPLARRLHAQTNECFK